MKRAQVTDATSGEVVGEVTRDTGPDTAPDATAARRGSLVLPSAPSNRALAAGRTRLEVIVDGWRFEFEVEDGDRAALRQRATRGRGVDTQHGPTDVRAIIPGRVLTVAVAPGDVVTKGQQLLTVEAMKMQNELRSPRDGTVERVAVAPGVTVEPGDVLVILA